MTLKDNSQRIPTAEWSAQGSSRGSEVEGEVRWCVMG